MKDKNSGNKLNKKVLFKPSIKKITHILIPILILGLIAFIVIIQKNTSASQCQGNGSSKIYEEAAVAFESGKGLGDQKQVVDKILNNRGYNSDINCIYPLMMYSKSVNDIDATKKYYGAFNELAKKGGKLYEGYKTTINDAQKTIEDFLKLKEEDPNGAVFYF